MPARLIDGKAIAAEIREQTRQEVAQFREATGVTPCLAVVLVGEDPASQYYIRSKMKVAGQLGIASEDRLLPEATSQEELLRIIDGLNRDPRVHGILVQLPLPGHIDKDVITAAVDPRKDVDGFHPYNLGCLALGGTPMPPCTPSGILALLDRTGVTVAGAEVVVVGRSQIVGKPVAMMLVNRHATVTICHSRTRDLPAVCRRADILVVAIGRARMVTAEFVKPGATVIDVGINRVEGRVVGDVDFDAVLPVAGALTPVPGGVGPMTPAMLMRNTLTAARRLTM
jgi:methylenetetrahydrofolate dehydrogenase (NADP+)/methenyltetrahydrofolate cyclohydrolase